MAAAAWIVYPRAKRHLGLGNIDLSGVIRCTLHTSASNASDASGNVSIISSVNNEIADGNGYSTSGKTMSANTWTAGASAKEYRLDSTAVFWSANGGSIANIKFAVLWMSGASAGARYSLAFSKLSTSQFTINDGSRITITPASSGIFELN